MELKQLLKLILVAVSINLTACSTFMNNDNNKSVAANGTSGTPGTLVTPGSTGSNVALGGSVSNIMDNSDHLKFSRALDKPLGKMTEWQNYATGIKYSVTPNKKVSVNNNSICRTYTLTYIKSASSNVLNGTACVDIADGNWHEV